MRKRKEDKDVSIPINSNRVRFENLGNADLTVDTVYESKRGSSVNLGIEPLTRLIPGASLMGGFRKRVDPHSGRIVGLILMSTGRETDWPDHLDIYNGTFTYYGDNREPGRSLLDTSRKGNAALEAIFEMAQGDIEARKKCPLILAFENTGTAHDTKFLGLLVPGTNDAKKDDLVAVWASKDGKRFQNYKAKFTVLDCGTVSGDWVRDIFEFKSVDLSDVRTPSALRKWISTGEITPLRATPKKTIRSIEEQRPKEGIESELIKRILEDVQEDPTMFEHIAKEIWKIQYGGHVESIVTRKTADGGRDAYGHIALGPIDDPTRLTFALEAKAYSIRHNVGVKEISRLISRLKHREFGVLVTTSAVGPQAYSEIRNDGHPLVIISGHDIAQLLIQSGINSTLKVSDWIKSISKIREG